MERASKNLTPVTLELGGKSPCIVDATANLKVAARRIAFGKWLNVGQTCVAPDYLLVDTSVHDELLGLIKEEAHRMFGEHPLDNEDYGHIVNAKHFARVRGLIDPDKVVLGGTARESSLKIEPTILDGVAPEDAVMQEEIFGPILPVLSFESLDEAEAFITNRPTPLALYIFSQDRAVQQRFVRYVPFGGGCVNDTIMHLATSHMGFGGMGASGMGQYHGRESFDTFSHKKSIVNKATCWTCHSAMPLTQAGSTSSCACLCIRIRQDKFVSARVRRLLNKVKRRFIRPLEELPCTSLHVCFCRFILQDFNMPTALWS